MADSIESISVAVASNLPEGSKALVHASLDAFAQVWGEVPLVVRDLDEEALFRAAASGEADFFFADARVYATLERYAGSRALLTAAPTQSADPQYADGLALLTPKTGAPADWRELLGGWRFAARADEAALLGALLRDEAGRHGGGAGPAEPAVATIAAGAEEDVQGRLPSPGDLAPKTALLVRACTTEENSAASRDWRVFEPVFSPELRCRATAKAIPGPAFAASLRVDAETASLLRGAFLALPPSSGWRWAPVADYRLMHDKLAHFDARYRELARPSAEALWRRFGPYVFAAAAAIALLLGLAFVQERRVKRRTESLVEALRSKEAADARFQALEKASAVSQMSSIVAHEIRQPLGAIRNFAGSLRLRLERGRLDPEALQFALDRMSAEVARADDIVEHVRSYARASGAAREPLDLSALVRETAASMSVPGLSLSIEPGVTVEADALEMKLIVENLLRNARDAVKDRPSPEIALSLSREGGAARLAVEDNGPPVSDADFERIATPLFTTKAAGLGLGLSIVRRLAESYGGRASFTRTASKSLRAEVRLPLLEPAGESAVDSSAFLPSSVDSNPHD